MALRGIRHRNLKSLLGQLEHLLIHNLKETKRDIFEIGP